ncbi:MAG: hypothetical protein ACRDUA_00835 [Micromonosporaceae bacterium]
MRAGVLDREDARRAARRARGETGILALSVFAALGQTVDELCRDQDLVRYRQVRTSTFGRLRRAGFPVLPTFAVPHYDVVLADLDDDTMDRLERCFEAPGPNPGRRPVSSS